MKAILMLNEMPECCLDCPCSYTYGYRVGSPTDDVCEIDNRKLTKENMNNKTPDWCPLIEINDNIAKLIEVAR